MLPVRLVALLFSIILVPCLQASQPVMVYTEDYPPYNFADDEGQAAGEATRNVRQIMDATGLEYEIKVVDWSEGLAHVEASDRALIYSMTRVPSREGKYNWLALLAPSSFYIYGLADDSREVTLEAIRAGQFRGACYIKDITCELFELAGIPSTHLIKTDAGTTADFQLVYEGKADLFMSEYVANMLLRSGANIKPDVARPLINMGQAAGFYLASGLHLDAEVRDKVLDAYQNLISKGEYELVQFERP